MEAHSDQWYVGWFRWSCRVLDRFVRLRRYDREHRYQHGTNLCHFFRTLFWGTTVAAASLAMWAWTAYVVVVMPLTMFPLAGLAHTIGLVLACIAGLAVLVFSVLLVLSAAEKVPEIAGKVKPNMERAPGFARVAWTYVRSVKQRFCPTITFGRR